ncbi:MAG TPA: hypothetical protein VMD04_06465 [Candidatus Margulisiibacteriota bacterium]|nr:hypothetical protein [Candidatus Margulisiibacteriota bacterium]
MNNVTTATALISGVISLALTVWFVLFTVLVVKKLDKIVELLEKK